MAESPNVGVNESRGVISYDRSGNDVKDCKKGDFNFSINRDGKDEVAVFQIKSQGELLREHISQAFPAGAFQKKSSDLNKQNYNVHMKKNGGYSLGDYFK